MPHGRLEVHLVDAKGLENTDIFVNMDPYVILTCRTQEQKSGVASGQGSNPKWNENFVFTITEGVTELHLKLMDDDFGSAHDFVGEATIPLDPVFQQSRIPEQAYNVVKNDDYKGQIKVSLSFTPEDRTERGIDVEDLGGWKQSAYRD